ncbi:MAG: mevalonate pyrophosphate decarboxylase, partial [Methanothrix sp.]
MSITNPEVSALKRKGMAIHNHLHRQGRYDALNKYNPEPIDGSISYGEGYPIIGIEKFLGYYDVDWNIAYSPSISLTANFSKARSFCRYVKDSGKDLVVLDGVSTDKYTKRMAKALSRFREMNNINGSFQFYVTREKKYADAKGLGESA